MNISISHLGHNYKVTTPPVDISIPLDFSDENLIFHKVPSPKAVPYRDGDFVGCTLEGGGCNFNVVTFIPHCHGTHTECVGHIVHADLRINDILKESFCPGQLITISPTTKGDSVDQYDPICEDEDMVIDRKCIETAFSDSTSLFGNALIIRTLPNFLYKKTKKYTDGKSVFFSEAAIQFVCELGVKHLLVDFPSIDRAHDEGKLLNHHIFWDLKPGSFGEKESKFSDRTITELIYVPEEIKDGKYLVEFQIPPFNLNAAPSRIRLFNIEKA